MPERPNFYLLLDLDPSVDDWKVIEQRIQDKQREWSRDRSMGNPKARRRAESGLVLLAEITAVLTNPKSRREEAKAAIRQQQKEKQEKARELDEAIALLRSSGTPCTDEQVRKLVQRFTGTFSENEIRNRLRAGGVPIGNDGRPERERLHRPRREMIDKVTASNIRQNLDHLKLATLYDFLALNPRSSPKALTDRADEIYRENQRLGRTDADASARNVLSGVCKTLFPNDHEKAKYDNYLVIEALEKLKLSLELAGSDNFISRDELDALIRQARQRGVSAEDARAYIEDYAAARSWGMQRDSDALSSEALRLCGFCSELAPATASNCPACGESLEIECPRCSARNPSANEACQSCGCRIGDAPLVKALLQEGYRLALEEDSRGALRCFDKALLYWPDWRPAMEARKRVEERHRESEGHRAARQEPKPPEPSLRPEKDLPRGPIAWLQSVPPPKVTNVTSKSFGICIIDPQGREVVANLICIDDPVPTTSSLRIETQEDGLRSMKLHCMENTLDERQVALSDCREIGQAIVEFGRPLPRGSMVEVAFYLGPDGLLTVRAKDVSTGTTVRAEFHTAAILPSEKLEAAKRRNLAQGIGPSKSPPRRPPSEQALPEKPSREQPPRKRDQVFISYSHKDKIWLERLQVMLKPLVRKGSISLWDDTKITPGKPWKQEIESALSSAKVAILLVSQDFIASDFVAENELPPLLRAAQQEGLVILWLCLGHCLFEETEIHHFQAVHDPSKPLSSFPRRAQWEKVLAGVARRVKEAMQSVPP